MDCFGCGSVDEGPSHIHDHRGLHLTRFERGTRLGKLTTRGTEASFSVVCSPYFEKQNMKARGQPWNTDDRPSDIRIVADMRRCAYDLDRSLSRQPPHIASNSFQ